MFFFEHSFRKMHVFFLQKHVETKSLEWHMPSGLGAAAPYFLPKLVLPNASVSFG